MSTHWYLACPTCAEYVHFGQSGSNGHAVYTGSDHARNQLHAFLSRHIAQELYHDMVWTNEYDERAPTWKHINDAPKLHDSAALSAMLRTEIYLSALRIVAAAQDKDDAIRKLKSMFDQEPKP